MNKQAEKYWGGNEDIADDVSEIYERITGKSSVWWSADRDCCINDTLDDRPEEYSTSGFTCDFETWGQENCDLAVASGMSTREMVIGWFTGKFASRKVYSYYVEDHDEDPNNSVSAEDDCAYGYWQIDAVYASLDSARQRMRDDYTSYRQKHDLPKEDFCWREVTLHGRHVWECFDQNNPYGWKIVEQEVK